MVRTTGTVAALCERRLNSFAIELGGRRPPLQLTAVVADRFDRAAFHRFLAKTLFLRRFRLLVNVRMSAVVVAFKVRRRRFTAKIAVDALIIDIKLSRNVLGIFVCSVSHIFSTLKVEGNDKKKP